MNDSRLNQLMHSTNKLTEEDKTAIMAKFEALKAKPVKHATKTIRNIRLVHHCGCGSDWSDDFHIVIPEDASPEDFVFVDYLVDKVTRDSAFADDDDIVTLAKMGMTLYRGNYKGDPANYPGNFSVAFGPDDL